MKQLAPFLALLLVSACNTTGGPPPSPDQPVSAPYHATGTEPFWSLDIDARTMRFSEPSGRPPVEEATPPVIHGFAGEIYQGRRINVNIIHGQCSNGMSDRTYPDQIQLNVDGRAYRGCGGAAIAPSSLVGTNWRVAAVNGRATTPAADPFAMNFEAARFSATFGCNRLGAEYRQTGDMVTAGPVIATRMACPDMRYENQGSAILSRPMRINWNGGDRLTLSNDAGSIEMVRSY